MNDSTDMVRTLSDYISEELLNGRQEVEPDENLLSDGMVDSLGMLRLVAYIEQVYGIVIPPEHFTIEHFRTVELLTAYLQRAQQTA